MKYYIKFINSKCYIDILSDGKFHRRSLSVKINDKLRQNKFRLFIIRLLEEHKISPFDVDILKDKIIDKLLSK